MKCVKKENEVVDSCTVGGKIGQNGLNALHNMNVANEGKVEIISVVWKMVLQGRERGREGGSVLPDIRISLKH
jgi:hypothetical protein